MTLDEAKKLAAIIGRADGGCSHCVQNLVNLTREAFSEFEWSYEDYEDVQVSEKDEN